jgi:VIT1/CCC1 family predicted Fe2+/Mn2+ transporter
VAFIIGAVLPMLAILLPPPGVRVPVTFGVVLVALALTGAVSAYLGSAGLVRAIVRLVGGGALAMAVTYAVGHLLGVAVG